MSFRTIDDSNKNSERIASGGTVTPIRVRISELLRAKSRVGSSVNSTLAKIDVWLRSIQVCGLRSRLDRAEPAKAKISPASNLFEEIAESLVENTGGAEGTLLSKSLQEALHYYVGFDAELRYCEFEVRFLRYLKRHGASPFLKRFLSLYFFNYVWFETGESFRPLARTSDAFEKYMEGVERVCCGTVNSIWMSFEKTQRPFDISTAAELVGKIEEHLHERASSY